MIVAVGCVALAFLVSFLGTRFIGWRVHLEMTTEQSKTYGRGSFDAFMRYFATHSWERRMPFRGSFFDYGTDSEIHASIIRFDGKGMTLGLIDWLRVQRFLRGRRLVVELGRDTVKWTDPGQGGDS